MNFEVESLLGEGWKLLTVDCLPAPSDEVEVYIYSPSAFVPGKLDHCTAAKLRSHVKNFGSSRCIYWRLTPRHARSKPEWQRLLVPEGAG